jgi:hypothetical protein
MRVRRRVATRFLGAASSGSFLFRAAALSSAGLVHSSWIKTQSFKSFVNRLYLHSLPLKGIRNPRGILRIR